LKRWAPFDATVNTIYWISRVVKWIYHQADMIPLRIQNAVDREHEIKHDAEWEIKNQKAEDKAKAIIAKEFPQFFKKKYLDSCKEGSPLYNENKAFLEAHRGTGIETNKI
jgi:hypothetical protein